MLVASNWTPVIQLFVGICSLLNTQDKLFNVGKTAIQQCLQTPAQATVPSVSMVRGMAPGEEYPHPQWGRGLECGNTPSEKI